MANHYFNTIRFKNYKIFYRIYHHNETTKTGILFLHGKISHSEYLDNIIDSYQGIKIFAFDFPGQGRSSGSRGHCNIFKLTPAIVTFIVNSIIKMHSISNLYIAGESLGALIGFYIYNKKLISDIKIKGLIFMPGVYTVNDFSNNLKILLLYILRLFIPWFPINSKRSYVTYTTNKEKLAKLETDTYLTTSNSVIYLFGIYRFYKYFRNHYHELKIPVLIFQGEYDYHSNIKNLSEFYKQIHQNAQNKIINLSNSKHWLLVGEETGVIKAELYEWIKYTNSLERN